MRGQMKKRQKISMRSGMVGLMLICWFLPFLLIAGMMGYYMSGNHFDNQLNTKLETMSFNNQVCAQRLEYAVTISKEITYEGSVNKTFRSYLRKEADRSAVLQACNYQLYRLYNHDECVQDAILWLNDRPEDYQTSTYNESTGGSYRHVRDYWENDHQAVAELAGDLDTGIAFYENEGRLYLIRNLMGSSFQNMATLVLRLNPRYCFDNLTTMSEKSDVTVYIDDIVFVLQGENVVGWDDVREEEEGIRGYYWHQNELGLYDTEKSESFTLTAMAVLKDTSMMTPFYGYRFILGGMVIFLVPMLFVTLHIFRKYVQRPVEVLMKGADEIEGGNLGYRIEAMPGPAEFDYIADSFNEMSEQLKFQFDHIYEEEIALRDAKIMALQSHINPHFMNNTLEIINWEARMNGDNKVSEMIEALATLMNATIDRKRRPEVTLSEEMVYVNAYLKILKERMGKRLQVKIGLPDEIMGCMVPRLILQPVIENAVEHGAARRGNGSVILQGRQEGDYLYLEIFNDGHMSEEEEQKVARLLDADYDTSKETSGNMGIANVNQRLKILYGEPCGLGMENYGDDQVRACLTILVGEENKKIQ